MQKHITQILAAIFVTIGVGYAVADSGHMWQATPHNLASGGTVSGNLTVTGTAGVTGRTTTTGGLANPGIWEAGFTGGAATGSTTSDAAVLSVSTTTYFITSGAANTGVRVQAGYTTPSRIFILMNITGSDKKVYPSTGGNFYGLAADTAITLTDGQAMLVWGTATGTHYGVKLN
jgi:hypothetical protein